VRLQGAVTQLLEWHAAWLCEGAACGLPDASVQWLYALTALVERPLPAAAAAAMRAVLRRCAALATGDGSPEPYPEGMQHGGGPSDASAADPAAASAEAGDGSLKPEPSYMPRGDVPTAADASDFGSASLNAGDGKARARIHVLVAIMGAYFRQDEALAWLSREEYV